jgi:hypothetical protein
MMRCRTATGWSILTIPQPHFGEYWEQENLKTVPVIACCLFEEFPLSASVVTAPGRNVTTQHSVP